MQILFLYSRRPDTLQRNRDGNHVQIRLACPSDYTGFEDILTLGVRLPPSARPEYGTYSHHTPNNFITPSVRPSFPSLGPTAMGPPLCASQRSPASIAAQIKATVMSCTIAELPPENHGDCKHVADVTSGLRSFTIVTNYAPGPIRH